MKLNRAAAAAVACIFAIATTVCAVLFVEVHVSVTAEAASAFTARYAGNLDLFTAFLIDRSRALRAVADSISVDDRVPSAAVYSRVSWGQP